MLTAIKPGVSSSRSSNSVRKPFKASTPRKGQDARQDSRKQAQERTFDRNQAQDIAARPAVGSHDAELDDPLHGAHEHRVGNADAADQECQADRQRQEQLELAHDIADLEVELRHGVKLNVIELAGDPIAEVGEVDERLRLDVKGRDALLVDVEQRPGGLDLHDDGGVDQERAGLVEADHVEFLAADQDRVAHFLGRAVGVGVVAGDLGADQDVGLADVVHREKPPAAFLRRKQSLLEDAAFQMQVLGKLLPFDQDRLGEAS